MEFSMNSASCLKEKHKYTRFGFEQPILVLPQTQMDVGKEPES